MSAAKRPVTRLTRWITGQAAHTYVDPIVFPAWRSVIKDVLNVQAGCRTSKHEWAYHPRSLRAAYYSALAQIKTEPFSMQPLRPLEVQDALPNAGGSNG